MDGSPKLPTKVPSPIPYCPIWNHDALRSLEKEKFIDVGLFKYMEFWKQGIEQNVTYVMKISLNVDCWEDILLHLSKSLLVERCIFWRVFSLLAIGNLIMQKLSCHSQC